MSLRSCTSLKYTIDVGDIDISIREVKLSATIEMSKLRNDQK